MKTAPKTKVAQTCYRNYERSIVMGFSGSAGVFIPAEERAKMQDLKDIAMFGAVQSRAKEVKSGAVPEGGAPKSIIGPAVPSATSPTPAVPSPFKPAPGGVEKKK